MAASYRMDGKTIVVPRSPDGYFFVPVFINGKQIVLEIDTAAGDVILNNQDIIALGVLPAYSASKSFITGNGEVRMNAIKSNIQVGYTIYPDMNVYLNIGWTGKSVMGISMLSQFYSVSFNKNEMRLEP